MFKLSETPETANLVSLEAHMINFLCDIADPLDSLVGLPVVFDPLKRPDFRVFPETIVGHVVKLNGRDPIVIDWTTSDTVDVKIGDFLIPFGDYKVNLNTTKVSILNIISFILVKV